jgi:hypothetical protein
MFIRNFVAFIEKVVGLSRMKIHSVITFRYVHSLRSDSNKQTKQIDFFLILKMI